MSGILAIVQRRRQRLGFWYRLVICIVKPVMLLLTKRDWHGAENIPSEGGIIVAATHTPLGIETRELRMGAHA